MHVAILHCAPRSVRRGAGYETGRADGRATILLCRQSVTAQRPLRPAGSHTLYPMPHVSALPGHCVRCRQRIDAIPKCMAEASRLVADDWCSKRPYRRSASLAMQQTRRAVIRPRGWEVERADAASNHKAAPVPPCTLPSINRPVAREEPSLPGLTRMKVRSRYLASPSCPSHSPTRPLAGLGCVECRLS
jgi:hypothetical protein